MRRNESILRVKVSGGEKLQDKYRLLSKGEPLTIEREGDRLSVFRVTQGFYITKRKYLGYLTNSEELIRQTEKGYRIMNPVVSGFEDVAWGKQLVLAITMRY
jgi:hypothetical protein